MYQWNWWYADPPTERFPVESARSSFDQFEKNWSGFALSLNRELYVAKHELVKGSGQKGVNFYHSSYLAGGPVMCAGSMHIEAGKVLAIKIDSGHYKPGMSHVVSLLQTLQMHGAPVAGIQIYDYNEKTDDGAKAKAEDFLSANGDWTTLLARKQAELVSRKYVQTRMQRAEAFLHRFIEGYWGPEKLYLTFADFAREYAYAHPHDLWFTRKPDLRVLLSSSHELTYVYNWTRVYNRLAKDADKIPDEAPQKRVIKLLRYAALSNKWPFSVEYRYAGAGASASTEIEIGWGTEFNLDKLNAMHVRDGRPHLAIKGAPYPDSKYESPKSR